MTSLTPTLNPACGGKRLSRSYSNTFVVFAVLGFVVCQAQTLDAAPSGAQIVGGQASFSQNGAITTIRAGNNAIINYQSFDIRPGETVQFIQPNSQSRVLNRVFGDIPSSIEGSLLANGRVYILNPSGIYFGGGSYVAVGGLAAVAGHMTDADFTAGVNRFTGLTGDVRNAGSITAPSITLVGQHVLNQGNLEASRGLVAMVAGDDVLIGQKDSHVYVNASKTTVSAGHSAGVENSGTITATGGRSILAAGDMYSLAVANSGPIHARDITLQGMGTGVVTAGGNLDASDASARGKGGTVQVLGEQVAVVGANIDASGRNGGGTILLGGDYHGGGTTPTARRTFVAPESTIRADATDRGDGGKIIVWSDEVTGFYGGLSARGGSQGGNGGFVEVSSGAALFAHGQVSLDAPRGRIGTVLYDPEAIEIRGGVRDGSDAVDFRNDLLQHGRNLPGAIGFGDEATPAAPPAGPFVIYQSELQGTDANIILEARRQISVAGIFNNDNVLLQNNRNLTLRTRNSLADGPGGINLTLNNDGVTDSSLEFRTRGSGTISIEAGTDGGSPANIIVGKLGTDHQPITLTTGNGSIDLHNTIVAGSLSVTAPGPGLIRLHNDSSGADLVHSDGQQDYDGAVVVQTAATLRADTGSIHLNGGLTGDAAFALPSVALFAPQGDITVAADVGGVASLVVQARNIALQSVFTVGLQDYQAAGLLSLNSTYVASSGDIRFNAAGNSANSTVATIVKQNPGDLIIRANNFAMGQNEKLVVTDGSLNLTAASTATLGDLAASQNITVTAPSITLLARGPDGAPNDTGLDFLARNITFDTSTLSFGGSTANRHALFLTTDSTARLPQIPGVGKEISAAPPFNVQSQDGSVLDPVAPVLPTVQPSVSAVVSLGSQATLGPMVEALTLDLISAQSESSVDPDKEPLRIQDLAGLVLLRQLQNLGVAARDPTALELAGALQGHGLYAQISTNQPPKDEDYVVVVRRVSKPAVWQALNTYWTLFYTAPPARGGKERLEQVKQALSGSYEAYVEQTGKDDAAGFLAFLESARVAKDPRTQSALRSLTDTKKLFDEVQQMGLTQPEATKARVYLAKKLATDVLAFNVLTNVIALAGNTPPRR